ncbi:MAG: dicarboxylate/amino acid:cation symporter [Acidobacteria bacterium]|nr:dicarboxylate/amino acid:cation symporter [Acidobacteriota bacterium]
MKKINLTGWIILGMVCGIAAGLLAPNVARELTPLGNIFLRAVKAIMAPLIFGALISAIAGTGDLKAMGRLGLRTFVYFWIVTTLALACGMLTALAMKPGLGVMLTAAKTNDLPLGNVTPMSFGAMLEQVIPNSLIDAMARGDVLQIVVFCTALGVACATLGEPARPLVSFAEALAQAMFRVTHYVMWLAPLGVAAAVAVTVANGGLGALGALGKLVMTLYVALALFTLLVLLPLFLWSRVSWRQFYQLMREPFLLAVTTTSSGVALPPLLENLERAGLSKRISGFVLPACFCFNLTGTTLYIPIAVLFTAQAAGVTLSVKQLALLFVTLMITSKGAPAVPRSSLLIIVGALNSLHLPLEGVALLLSVEVAMDPVRTGVNILGHGVAPLVIARWESEPLPAAPLLQDEQLVWEAMQ